jgi:hypothetical protein
VNVAVQTKRAIATRTDPEARHRSAAVPRTPAGPTRPPRGDYADALTSMQTLEALGEDPQRGLSGQAPGMASDGNRESGVLARLTARIKLTGLTIPRMALSLSSLNYPRCGLSIELKAGWLTVDYCPRARIRVKLFSSPLLLAELSPEGSVPNVGQRRVAKTIPARSRSTARPFRIGAR